MDRGEMATEPNMARRLWRVVRAVLFMLRKGMPKRKLAMDLHLLIHRGKIAGKALGNLMTSGHHDKASAAAVPPPPPQFSCGGRGRRRAVDPSLAVYDPRGSTGTREVEFSCSNTPSYYPSSFHLIPTVGKRRRRNNNNNRRSGGTHLGANGAEPGWYNYDANDIARIFEILNNNDQLLTGGGDDHLQPSPLALIATPSPALWASFGRTPAHVRQLRITDSPFPLSYDDGDGAGQVDMEAEEFIKKFYEQLRTQQSLATATPTPDYYGGGYARPVSGIA